MTYCVKCGAELPDGTKFCSYCGEPVPRVFEENEIIYESEPVTQQQDPYTYGQSSGQASFGQNPYGQTGGQDPYGYQQTYDYDPERFSEAEISGNKAMAVVCYLGILVLLPLLAGNKNSLYLKHHLNQGIALFVVNAILAAVTRLLGHVAVLGWALDIVDLALFIIMIMGIVSAAKGTRKPLPFMENIQVFK